MKKPLGGPEDEKELKAIYDQIRNARGRSERERVQLITRLLATFLSKRGHLPEHLKKWVTN